MKSTVKIAVFQVVGDIRIFISFTSNNIHIIIIIIIRYFNYIIYLLLYIPGILYEYKFNQL